MGLTLDVFGFPGPPPTDRELRAHVRTVVGSDDGLDSFAVKSAEAAYRDMPYRAELLCMLDVKTRPYACAFLMRHGGVPIHRQTGLPRSMNLPAFVERPWREWPLWKRARFRFGV